MNILIVDDNLVGRKLLKSYMDEFGNCQTASTGYEAVKVFKIGLESGENFDLVTLDIVMPGMDGRAVLQSLRQLELEYDVAESNRVKIVMTTALDDRMDIIESFNDGCEGYIIKPVTKDHLVRVLTQLKLIA